MAQVKMYFENELPSSGSRIPVGIHDKGDIFFNGLRRNEDWWELHFSSKSGQVQTKRLFQPNANFINEGETPSDALKRSEDKNIAVVTVALRCLLGESVGDVEFDSYEDFMHKSADLLKGVEGTTICLKVSPDPKKPEYGKVPDYKYMDSYLEGFPTALYWTKKEKQLLEDLGIAA